MGENSNTLAICSFYQTEAVNGDVLQKKVFLEISQNSQEYTCARVSFLIKLQAWGTYVEHLWATASDEKNYVSQTYSWYYYNFLFRTNHG